MYAPPNPKKIAWQRRQAELARRREKEIAQSYREHLPGQSRFARSVKKAAVRVLP